SGDRITPGPRTACAHERPTSRLRHNASKDADVPIPKPLKQTRAPQSQKPRSMVSAARRGTWFTHLRPAVGDTTFVSNVALGLSSSQRFHVVHASLMDLKRVYKVW